MQYIILRDWGLLMISSWYIEEELQYGFVQCCKNEMALLALNCLFSLKQCVLILNLFWFKDLQGTSSSLSTWFLWLAFHSKLLQGVFPSKLVKTKLSSNVTNYRYKLTCWWFHFKESQTRTVLQTVCGVTTSMLSLAWWLGMLGKNKKQLRKESRVF